MNERNNEPKAPSLFRWRAFLMILRQALLMVVTWIEKELNLKRSDK